MLSRPHRATRGLLESVFSREGRKIYPRKRLMGNLINFTAVKLDGGEAKLAFIVSAKSTALAVDRNRIKRRARAVTARLIDRLPGSYLFIFEFTKAARSASFSTLESDILSLLSPYLLKTKN